MKQAQTKISMGAPVGKSPFLVYAATGVFHLIGVLLVFGVMMSLTLTPQVALSVAETSWGNEMLREAFLWRVGLQFGLAACFWALIYIVFTSLRLNIVAARTPRVVRRAAGTVVTETLIVMPVLLLLVFGLAQLSLNNIAGILGHVASFQAARTVWVWEPEGVSDAELKERVRVAVAAVMTPVAGGNYAAAYGGELSHRGEAMSVMMEERFHSAAGGGGAAGRASSQSFAMALDGDASHTSRASRKFLQAYRSVGAISLARGQGGAPVGATMLYQHHQAMPLVGPIFGKKKGGNYYHEFTIGMSIPSQLYGVGRPEGW